MTTGMVGNPRPRIALATSVGAWELDEDAPLLLRSLLDSGAEAVPAVWDDPSVDWSSFSLVVVRSTWDYTGRLEEFLAWAERVESITRLRNSTAVLEWNTDKRYLGDLAARGLAVVPTAYVLADRPRDPGALDWLEGVESFVVKPTVSAGSKDTARYWHRDRETATDHVDRLLSEGRDVMLQPYVPSVDTLGETGLVHLGGEFSHAFRKGPLLLDGPADVDGLFAVEQIDPRTATTAELELAEAVLSATAELTGDADLLYARIDLLTQDDGSPLLLEVELTEPSWFLEQAPGATDRAVEAILRAATG